MGEFYNFGASDGKDELASRQVWEDSRWHRFREALQALQPSIILLPLEDTSVRD